MCCEVGGPISSGYLVHCSHHFLTRIRIVFLVSYIYAILESYDADFATRVVYKPWVLSVSAETLVPITAILIPVAESVLLLHQLVIELVSVHLM